MSFSSLTPLAIECYAVNSSELVADKKSGATKWGKFAMNDAIMNSACWGRRRGILNPNIGGRFGLLLRQDAHQYYLFKFYLSVAASL